MPAASYVSAPIERSLAFVKNSTTSSSSNHKFRNDLSNGKFGFDVVDLTSHSILSTSLDFIKYDKLKGYDKSKYEVFASDELNANIHSICSNYNKKLSQHSSNHLDRKPLSCLNKTNGNASSGKCVSSSTSTVAGSGGSTASSKCLLPKPKQVLFSADKIQLGWQGRVPPGAGLVNAINTCYLNSCLQALFHIPSFHNWLLTDTEHQSLCEKQNGYHFECLVCAMRKTLESCQSRSGGAIRPELIIKKLKLIARHLEHHRQEDSHEFLTYLIEGMQKSYLKVIPGANKLDSYSKETTPIYQLFGSYLRTEVTCNACHNISTSYTHSTELSLDIRQSSSINEALAHFFAKETLGGDNLYKCEKCGKKVEATKRFSVDKPPNVLKLQLKRFNYHGLKNSRSVTVPMHLEFGKFMHCKFSHSQLKYKLVSAVIHHGSSPDSGHYTCVGSTSSGTYHYFDDEMVRPSNLHQLTNAYVVIYELVQTSNQPKSSSFNSEFKSSFHSSSPGLNNNANTVSTKKSSSSSFVAAGSSTSGPSTTNTDRKLIGPLLPHENRHSTTPNTTTISSSINTNIDISSLTSSCSPTLGNNPTTAPSAASMSKLGGVSPTSKNQSNGLVKSISLNGIDKSKSNSTLDRLKWNKSSMKNNMKNEYRQTNGLTTKSNGQCSSGNLTRSMPDLDTIPDSASWTAGSGVANSTNNDNSGKVNGFLEVGNGKVKNGGKDLVDSMETKSGVSANNGQMGAPISATTKKSGTQPEKFVTKSLSNGNATNGKSVEMEIPKMNGFGSGSSALKRTTKLVDYESDSCSSDDDAEKESKSCKGGSASPMFAYPSKKSRPTLNGWTVLASTDKDRRNNHNENNNSNGKTTNGVLPSSLPATSSTNSTHKMDWKVTPVTPSPVKSKTSSSFTSPSTPTSASSAGSSTPMNGGSIGSPSPSSSSSGGGGNSSLTPSKASPLLPSPFFSASSSSTGYGVNSSSSSSSKELNGKLVACSSSSPPTGGASTTSTNSVNASGTTSSFSAANAYHHNNKQENVRDYLNNRTMSARNSYGSNNVTSWNNEPSSLIDPSMAAAATATGSSNSTRFSVNSKFPRYNAGPSADDADDDMDRGRVKKTKSKYKTSTSGGDDTSYYSKPNGNPFNHYHRRKNFGGNNNGQSNKYHYLNNKYSYKQRHQFRNRPYWQQHR